MSVSGFLLWLAQRYIPIGTAYAVWTGIDSKYANVQRNDVSVQQD
jgi:multidrug transporter EmrE-like cation transporter